MPVWGHLISWAAIFATSLLVWALGRLEGWGLAGFLLGLGWLVTPAVVNFLGGEYPPAIALVAGSLVA